MSSLPASSNSAGRPPSSSVPTSATAASSTAEGSGSASAAGTVPWALGPPIRVGDVGFVCDGVFCRLFSAALPPEHPAQRDLGVPKGFTPIPVPEYVLDLQTNLPEHTAGKELAVGTLPVLPSAFNKEDIGPIFVLAQAIGDEPSLATLADPKHEVVRLYIRTHMAAWLEFAHALNVGITAREIFLVRGCYAIPPPAHARNGLTVLAASAPPAPVAPESHSGANPQPTPNSNPTSSETASDEQTPEQEAPGPSDAGPSAGGSHSHTLSQSQSQTDDVTKAIVTSSQVALAAAKRRMHAARFVCPICGTSLTTKRNLEGHVNAHLGVKAHKCTFCEDYFNRTWDRKRHEQRMHPAELASANGTVAPDGSYMPDQDTNADSSGVMDESENDPDREVDELDGDDDDMSASMSTSAHLSGPVPVEHSISLPQWQALASPSVASPGPSNVNSNSIDASASPSGFGKASRAGKAPKSPKSPKGAKSVKPIVTTAPIALASDRRRTREARFICDLCGRALTTRTNLEGHRNAHLGRKEHKCGVCEEGFAREWDRKRHERRAHGVGKDGGKDGIEPAEGMEESVSAAGSPAPDASMVPAPGPEMLGAPSGTDLGLPVSSGSGIDGVDESRAVTA